MNIKLKDRILVMLSSFFYVVLGLFFTGSFFMVFNLITYITLCSYRRKKTCLISWFLHSLMLFGLL